MACWQMRASVADGAAVKRRHGEAESAHRLYFRHLEVERHTEVGSSFHSPSVASASVAVACSFGHIAQSKGGILISLSTSRLGKTGYVHAVRCQTRVVKDLERSWRGKGQFSGPAQRFISKGVLFLEPRNSVKRGKRPFFWPSCEQSLLPFRRRRGLRRHRCRVLVTAKATKQTHATGVTLSCASGHQFPLDCVCSCHRRR